ncbi:peptidylprolyl isomerase [Amphibacillus cookii]|uniref:peptidylprolyl isomerase n=1 Tax=Amphibacillus cookii TaxID=767787 RepID=UPI00195EA632|nr:peptidylprolyl isomerase [Amphibacillus cookii]MBM7541511.1 foldase protein PrsA [Amphibacillus cookii]
MKKLAIVATLTVAFIGLAACSSDDSEVVVEMDQGNISKEEFYEELKSTAGESVIQNMVYLKILEDRYEIDESEIDQEVDKLKEEYGDSFEMVLQTNNFQDEEEFRENLRFQILQTEAITEDIEVSDEEIEQYYERLSNEIEASHILVEDEELANDLYDQLMDGADFAELAEEHSTDTQSAAEGGNLGYFSAGQMVSDFEDKAYSLGIDEIGEPVNSDYGWHIIKVTDIRESETELPDLEDMRASIRRDIATPIAMADQEAAMNKMNALLEESNIQVNIEEFEALFETEPAIEVEEEEIEEE